MNKTLKIAVKYALYYAPRPLQERLRKIQMERELREGMERAKRTRVSKAEFLELMDRLDWGSDIFLHTSMLNVGKIEGGAKFIADTLSRKVDTERYTLLVSALPYRGSFWEYLRTNPTFDVRTADIAMGAVNERLAARPDACRSIHPTHSVVAIGKRAAEYTATHHLDKTPFGPHSPYWKLFLNKGKILLLGATLNNVTAIHALEDALGDSYPIDIYAADDYPVTCYDGEGKPLIVSTKCHHPLKCISRDGVVLRKPLEACGGVKAYPLGESEALLIDALKYAQCFFDQLAQGRSIYGGRHAVTPELLEAIGRAKQALGIE